MIMSNYATTCYRIFGRYGDNRAKSKSELNTSLQKAHIDMLPGVYIAVSLMSILISFIIGLILAFVFFGILIPIMGSGSFFASTGTKGILLLVFFIIIPFLTYLIHKRYPTSKAKSRGREIDKQLPYASSFVSAMAASNATPERIFKSLADQHKIYGALSEDSAWIYRDMTVLGTDTVTAIKRAVSRASSNKLAEFYQGITSTITSGGNLKLYFLNRAEYFMVENRREQRETIETTAMMAESYVVVAVAFPMFLIVMMVIMMWVGGGGAFSMSSLYMVIFILLPIIHFGYGAFAYMGIPKV